MVNTTIRLVAGAAAASLAIAPIAAQANTRAGDAAPVYGAETAQPGLARSVEGEELRGRPGILIALLAAAAAIAGIVVMADNEADDISPGA